MSEMKLERWLRDLVELRVKTLLAKRWWTALSQFFKQHPEVYISHCSRFTHISSSSQNEHQWTTNKAAYYELNKHLPRDLVNVVQSFLPNVSDWSALQHWATRNVYRSLHRKFHIYIDTDNLAPYVTTIRQLLQQQHGTIIPGISMHNDHTIELKVNHACTVLLNSQLEDEDDPIIRLF